MRVPVDAVSLISGPAAAGACNLPVLRLREGRWIAARDSVAIERAIALQYNGISHVVMLATPTDLEDFALGFSLTEGIVGAPGEIHDLEIEADPRGVTVAMRIASARFETLKQRRRTLTGRTGCGLCGVDSLAQALPDLPRLPEPALAARFNPAAVLKAVEALRACQPLHDETGATHAAGFADAEGRLLCVREDVGRHNALDKLVGALASLKTDRAQGMMVVTSRASHEMVAKTSRAGTPLLAAVSGVTQLALETARSTGLCLTGFVRGRDLTVYTHPERLRGAPSFADPDLRSPRMIR